MNDTRSATRPLSAAELARVEEALPEVRELAKLMSWRCPAIDMNELVAVGRSVLARDVRRFDPSRGPSLVQFSRKAMQGAMLRASRKEGRHPVAAALRAVLTHSDAVEERVDLAAEISATDEERSARALALGADAALVAFCAYEVAMEAQPSPEEALSARQEQAMVRETVAELGEGGALLELLYFRELDWVSAAAELGISVSSAQRLETKLLPRLRAALRSRGVLPEVA